MSILLTWNIANVVIGLPPIAHNPCPRADVLDNEGEECGLISKGDFDHEAPARLSLYSPKHPPSLPNHPAPVIFSLEEFAFIDLNRQLLTIWPEPPNPHWIGLQPKLADVLAVTIPVHGGVV